MHGYTPPLEEVQKLGNVCDLYSSGLCVSDTYWYVRSKMSTTGSEKLLVEYNIKCSIPDVVQYSSEFGFDLRGEEWMEDHLMACDAPFIFTAEVDEDEDDEDEGDV